MVASDHDLLIELVHAKAVSLGTAFLRSALSHFEPDDPEAAGNPLVACEVATRLVLSHLLFPTGRIPIGSDADVRRFAERSLVPILTGGGS